ncbi:MAG: leucine--tRNA ligase [Patescibacteria group bacterium]
MKAYDHKKIELKWQKEWEKNKIYNAPDKSPKPKYYSLIEFPYPSGDGLHVGHPRPYIGMDVISRKKRMEGYNVLYPIGWDAFGLPTENYAIKTKQDPRVVTIKNVKNFTRQIKSLGISFDWSREINTTDPKYYKWTQWIFLQFLKKGLAYKDKIAINWCPVDKIGLANEEVVAGCCERCGSPVEKREKEQWMLRITKYADRLDKDLDTVDFLPHIKLAQKNWIGKSEGAEIDFKIGKNMVKVFTTRPDTIYGATYLVLAPEHELLSKIKSEVTNWNEVQMYQLAAKAKNELDRTKEDKDKTGVELEGVTATNPATGEPIPVWVADYVLANYGTGAIMAVPAHDERDLEFAKKFNLPVVEVVTPDGILINSGRFDGLKALETKQKITDFVGGESVTRFKLRDWVFSRQRYWGEPIPVIHCADCGIVPVPEKDLPVELPKVKNYEPTEDGESPLANISKWVNVKCPKCAGKATRETDTMPNWAGSSWYYLRYTDPKNSKAFADKKKLDYWTPVDWYNGGNEHTTLHLLYSRFWHKFLYDLKLVPTSEPYKKRTSHGFILAQNGEKMSKSRGNVINPDDIVARFGADTMRMYEMFMGPFDQAIAWSEEAIIGPRRFLERVWVMGARVNEAPQAQQNRVRVGAPGERVKRRDFAVPATLNKLIKKVTEDIDSMKFNTAISSLMIFSNEKSDSISKEEYEIFLKLLAPFAPHMTEEIWHALGNKSSITLAPWPKYDPNIVSNEEIKIVIQVNGKVRGEILALPDVAEEALKAQAMALPAVAKHIQGLEIKKMIYVKGRLINIVI